MSLDAATDRTITLVSRRDETARFELPLSYLRVSTLVNQSLESDPTATEVKVDISKETLANIVTYLNHHKGGELPTIERPLRSRVMAEVVPKFDAEFIDTVAENKQALYDLIMGSLFLDIRELTNLGCAKVASLIKGLPLDRIKQALNPPKAS